MMLNNFIFDFLWGIGLLILVILFYVITSGTFFPTLNFHEFKFQELLCFLKNLNLVYYYSISLTLHIFLSFIWLLLGAIINSEINELDVLFICSIPPFTYTIIVIIHSLTITIVDKFHTEENKLEWTYLGDLSIYENIYNSFKWQGKLILFCIKCT